MRGFEDFILSNVLWFCHCQCEKQTRSRQGNLRLGHQISKWTEATRSYPQLSRTLTTNATHFEGRKVTVHWSRSQYWQINHWPIMDTISVHDGSSLLPGQSHDHKDPKMTLWFPPLLSLNSNTCLFMDSLHLIGLSRRERRSQLLKSSGLTM